VKRFHVHVHVADLQKSIGFYSSLFGAEPSVLKPDYAKWMLEDPRLNFAISDHGRSTGVAHLGLQVDTEEELVELGQRARPAADRSQEERDTRCCYARSNKLWLHDPQGVVWETFRSFGSVDDYGAAREGEKACGCAS
jgi:catechol 2,3-dioxygenase-like lactoylglutathione lyase family enzyme